VLVEFRTGLHQAKLAVGVKMMDRQTAPRHVGGLRPARHRLDEIAMIELDLEGHVLEVVRREIERGLGEIDTVIVMNLSAAERPHLARVATGNVEEGEGPIEAPVERVVKQRANGGMRKLVAVDQLLVGRPLSLKLFQRGCSDDGAAWLKLMDEDIHHADFPSLARALTVLMLRATRNSLRGGYRRLFVKRTPPLDGALRYGFASGLFVD